MGKTEQLPEKMEVEEIVAEKREKQQEVWRKDEDNEEEDEAEDEEEVGLQERRHSRPSAAVTAGVELRNGVEEQEKQQKELEHGDNGNNNEVKVVDFKEGIRSEMNVYHDKDQGFKSLYGFSATENIGVWNSASVKTPGDDGFVIAVNNFLSQDTLIKEQTKGYLKDDGISSFRLLPSENPSEEEIKSIKSSGEITVARDGVEPKKESNQKIELDVERVLEEQDTHDLYCPNCNSCITRKVILRKRKRNIGISGEDAKRNKMETVDNSLDGRLAPAPDIYKRESEEEVFRCLSCFSFFIPSGNGFKLFNIFGDKSMQSTQPVPPMKKSWLFSILTSRKENTLSEQESSQEVTSGGTAPYLEVANGNLVSLTEGNKLLPNAKADVRVELKDGSESRQEVTSKPQGFGNPIIINGGAAQHQMDSNGNLPISGEDEKLLPLPEVDVRGELKDGKKAGPDATYALGASLPIINGIKVDMHVEEPRKPVSEMLSLSIKDALKVEGLQDEVSDVSKQVPAEVGAGKDTIIIIKEPVGPGTTREAQGLTLVETQPSPRTERAEDEGFQGIEIVKSIVYGGLAESIASLGVVSSAAGADTATVNILALGLANLIGGLFVICHNLWDLKNDQYSAPTDQISENASTQSTTQQDRYQQLLGRKKNFWIHAAIALLSFLIFGLLPPVIYAFSFRESDNRDFKLIAVAASSLLCVFILAIGKAYIQRPPKAYLKTISFYVVMVFMTSGVAYAFGDLFKQLLEKLGWFSSGVALNLAVLETAVGQPAPWASYR